ncbi:hypothetical protein KIL84_010244, partial [Mauremys mutica]
LPREENEVRILNSSTRECNEGSRQQIQSLPQCNRKCGVASGQPQGVQGDKEGFQVTSLGTGRAQSLTNKITYLSPPIWIQSGLSSGT